MDTRGEWKREFLRSFLLRNRHLLRSLRVERERAVLTSCIDGHTVYVKEHYVPRGITAKHSLVVSYKTF